ncbi:MAG: 23S rRNA (guanosine(2251)-2'-O)-methyltransferase RlmB [Burkholderiaceae bacterium]|jgi:23S rRNA (guanosine2251-2'-O)-methyltransferase|nr:23S rRNA (guanosine(2251)-2'-O)-methyltransferase RlmB [Burkholderiaceae bacterium]
MSADRQVLAGFHAVAARVASAPESIEVLYVDPQRHDQRMRRLCDQAEAAGVRVMHADARRLHGLAGEVPHQGVVALCAAPAALHRTLDDVLGEASAGTLLLLLDGVTDPRNLGACLRTADAAGAAAVIVPRDRSASMTAVVAKAAAGAAESTPLIAVTNLARAMEEIKQAGVWIAGAAGDADRSLYELDLTGPIAWVLGAEGEGLRRLTRDKCDWLVRIPLAGQVESLNVSVATGICLFETARQRRARAAG